VGPPDVFAWHLADEYSQLRRARESVRFTDRRTRVAHLDTGYYWDHVTVPRYVRHDLERSFVPRGGDPSSAIDPDARRLLLDASGHGTGTLSILAGGNVPGHGVEEMGGAPLAEVVPLRIADSVVLLRTSSFAQALLYALEQGCDVATMSMGGLPSRVWSDAVNRAYLNGLCLVAAAGNNYGGLPTRHVVYPARYGRVIAACGAMADHTPYHGLRGRNTFEGNYGPASVMGSALAAYTPNIPWAVFGCRELVRLNGEGTSSATPQIAAAVALWYERYKNDLPRDWRRVEAVRHALFSSARKGDSREFGNGILRAADALQVRPVLGLPQTREDRDSFAFLRVLTGLGLAEAPPREEMFNLELSQRWLVNERLQEIVPDPGTERPLDEAKARALMEAVIEDEGASHALRRHVASRYPAVAGKSPPSNEHSREVVPEVLAACEETPAIPDPPFRRLNVFALDPSLSTRLDTAAINEVALEVRWEDLDPGPVGEYLEVHDVDATGHEYPPVDLNDPRLLARDGWAPSEGNPQFHQQMVYAVAMKTIEHFERALGRPVFWRPRVQGGSAEFTPRLVIRPHALRQANAFYSPQNVALEFGYFENSAATGELVPGTRVYACLSHDIIAHETTHAILDGMYRRFNEPTNPDVLAFHEAFADIVALMQHFTIGEILKSQIARTRGDLEAESLLGNLAVQFGHATGRGGALREAIGRVENGVWKRLEPEPARLGKKLSPHARGAILVAAVFDAFIAIYRARIADLLRISTGGTGVLPTGAIHPDLVNRLAAEASKSASHVLTMCIRALDYLPPVDLTFFEYLRALITADFDIVGDDRYNYRVAFVEAFRRHGIYPANLPEARQEIPRSMSVDTLRWRGFEQTSLEVNLTDEVREHFSRTIDSLKGYADACFYIKDRETLFTRTEYQRAELKMQLEEAFESVPDFGEQLGIDPTRAFEVYEIRRAMRVGPDGRHVPQVVLSLTQTVEIEADSRSGKAAIRFSGGSTLLVDLSIPIIKYRIIKNVASKGRLQRTLAFMEEAAADPLRALFFGADRPEPFAALHALADERP
jgi:hypothetical protein